MTFVPAMRYGKRFVRINRHRNRIFAILAVLLLPFFTNYSASPSNVYGIDNHMSDTFRYDYQYVTPTVSTTTATGHTPSIEDNADNTSTASPVTDWDLPRPLNADLNLSHKLHKYLSQDRWHRPKVLLAYARPQESDVFTTDLFVYATGVRLGTIQRNITVVGCLISNEVYPVNDVDGEVYLCDVKRPVEVGEKVGLVLQRDEGLEAAMKGERRMGWSVKIEEEDICQLPNDTKLHVDDEFSEVTTSDLVTIPSDVKITHVAAEMKELRRKGRYEVCLGTQVRTFQHLLGDWVEYHQRLGVDMVYVLDNEASPDLLRHASESVEVVYWPWEKSQTQALSYLAVALRERCEWVVMTDADEYVLIGLHEESQEAGDLREYLRQRPAEEKQHFMPYLTMGPSGQGRIPTGPAAEVYTYKSPHQNKHNGKVAARADEGWVSSRVHTLRTLWHVEGGTGPVRDERPGFGGQAILVHFAFRSFEELLQKRRAGSGSIGDMQSRTDEVTGEVAANITIVQVPPTYKELNETLRYTFFRDVWRKVVKVEKRQVLVRSADGARQVRRGAVVGGKHAFA